MYMYLIVFWLQVREKLLTKQMAMERSEKAKKMRELRKYGKKVGTVDISHMKYHGLVTPHLGQQCFKKWSAACLVPSHYPKQCWLIVMWSEPMEHTEVEHDQISSLRIENDLDNGARDL